MYPVDKMTRNWRQKTPSATLNSGRSNSTSMYIQHVVQIDKQLKFDTIGVGDCWEDLSALMQDANVLDDV